VKVDVFICVAMKCEQGCTATKRAILEPKPGMDKQVGDFFGLEWEPEQGHVDDE
jgi:hypothetical protein